MSGWKLTYKKFDQDSEALRETLCTLGNGYFGTRGAAPESMATKVHYPGTYIAGVYNTLSTDVANRTIHNEDFVNCPNWLMFNYRINDGPWIYRLNYKRLNYKKELNLKKGMLSRRFHWQDEEGRITLVESHRIVSMADPHCGAIRYTITPENYKGKITIRSGIDGLIVNGGVERYKQLNSQHLIPSSHGAFEDDGVFLQMQTSQSKIEITEAMRNLVYKGHKQIYPDLEVIAHGRQRIFHEFSVDVKKGERLTVEKIVSIYTSRDQGVADNCELARKKTASIKNFDALYKPHQAKWKSLWKRFDIEIEGDEFIQLILRLHTFHLLQSASTYNEDIDAGMPVRGLHGEAYRGHVFWDELFVFPFYNLHAPEITRALLMYRYRRLQAAKENALSHGFKGAMYPWQTASKGDEQTQIIHLNPLSNTWGPDYSSLQHHVSIAVAYNVWNYFYTTSDRDFLDRYGAEMIVEIAHFWGSKATFNTKTRRYEIKNVMGPDEFHEKYPGADKGGIHNNAYTNVLAVWVIEKALHILDEMMMTEDREALLIKANISQEDLSKWRGVIEKMTVPMDQNGIIHQFEGYMDLQELDWDEYKKKYGNIHRIDRILKAEGQFSDSYKVAKQADVLMMFYVLNLQELKKIFTRLGYPFPKDIVKKNFEYYFPRTSHGSTLSMVVHAYVAEIIGDRDQALSFFTKSLESDVYDTQGGTTQEGIHTGVMGATIDLFMRSFGGLEIYEDRISLNPKLPKGWHRVKFNVRFKNIWFHVEVIKDSLKIIAKPMQGVSLSPSTKIPIEIRKKTYHLIPGKLHNISTKTLFLI